MLNSFDKDTIIKAIQTLSKDKYSGLTGEIENICNHITKDTPEYNNYLDAMIDYRFAKEKYECYKIIVWENHKDGVLKDFENNELETLINRTKDFLAAETKMKDALKKLFEKVIV